MEKPVTVWLRRVERMIKWALVVLAVWWGWTAVHPKLVPYIRAVQVGLSSNPKTWTQYEAGVRQTNEEQELSLLNQALENQGFRPIGFPAGYWSMNASSQFVVLLNLVRSDMGFPALHRSAALDRVALQGAKGFGDPPVRIPGSGGVWIDDQDPVFSLYAFLYEDGYYVSPPFGRNLDCPAPHAPGCWGHRRVLLGNYGPDGQIGAALVYVHGSSSFAAALAP